MKPISPKIWKPTTAGMLFTGSDEWEFQLYDTGFKVKSGGKEHKGQIQNLEELKVVSGYFWASVEIPINSKRNLILDGIPNQNAQLLNIDVQLAVKRYKDALKRQLNVESNLKSLQEFLPVVIKWSEKARKDIQAQLTSKGWLSQSLLKRISDSKPFSEIDFGIDEVKTHINQLNPIERGGLTFWQSSLEDVFTHFNAEHYKNVLVRDKSFFDEIEKSPLTEEQIKAVVCFDNRTLLVASAGSGKTSTMVAKCGYALKHGYFNQERILLLAFNTKAADELERRIQQRFTKHSLPYQDLSVKTFHAFGLEVIGKALGKRPSIPSWLESGKEIETMESIVDELKDKSSSFRMYWDLFRIVFSHDLPTFGNEADKPDSWDRNKETKGFWTFNNEIVKSRGELILANWFFYNGIKYQYEAPYKVDTANADFSQYTPDFYFPDIDVYLEHWALDASGEPPSEFKNYKRDMAWKRELHAKNNTHLLETTMADLWSGKAFEYLQTSLTNLGIKLDPNPDREVPGKKPIENKQLLKTFRSFLTHVKSNRLTTETLKKRLQSGVLGNFKYRHQIFLMLFEAIWSAWDNKLESEKSIDFDDMINIATDLIEQDRWSNPYELIMVDEFQDLSQSRTRLLHGLLNKTDQYFFAVGDDWQSINRFAGAHLGVMTDFEANFGKSTILKLETTFRCPQSLCDISSQFIQKNPKQLKKTVKSKAVDIESPLAIVRVPDKSHIQSVIQSKLQMIQSSISHPSNKESVFILGRYNEDRGYLPKNNHHPNLVVKFATVHSSKGLEADHVIVPKVSSENLGFPSQIEDDPVLLLAMPEADAYAYAEERRLFYVALTRARKTVTLITIERKESPFIMELVDDVNLPVQDMKGEFLSFDVCPKCQRAFIVEKVSRYGKFLSCSAYPMCDYKPSRKSKEPTLK